MHSNVRLQLTLDIPEDVLNVGNASIVDFLPDIVSLETVLQIAFLDQERNFYRGKRTGRCQVLDAWQQIAGCHLVNTPFVEGLAVDDLPFLRGEERKDDRVESDIYSQDVAFRTFLDIVQVIPESSEPLGECNAPTSALDLDVDFPKNLQVVS